MLTLHTDSGTSYTIPSSIGELSFGQWCDGVAALAAVEAAASSVDPDEDVVVGAVAFLEVIGCTGDFDVLPVVGEAEDEVSLMMLQLHAAGLLKREPDPDLREVAYDHPELGRLSCSVDDLLAVEARRTVADHVEYLELQRRIPEGALVKGATDAFFELTLAQAAVMLKAEGERLPRSQVERDEYVRSKAMKLADLPATVALDLRDLLLGFTIARSGVRR